MSAFARDERGATAIEYGLITALICVTVVTAISALGTTINTLFFQKIVNALGG